ncbi:hypothetical protein JI58_06935, partial [Marinosulfonomonas sp. PRT-SC04]
MRKYLADKNTRPTQNPKAIALARQEIVEYIVMVQNLHDLSLRKAVIHFPRIGFKPPASSRFAS